MRMVLIALVLAGAVAMPAMAHGGGLNACGCHFNRKTGECHCHRPRACGCECEPPACTNDLGVADLGLGAGEPPEGARPGTPPEAEPPTTTAPTLDAHEDSQYKPVSAGGCGVER